jgi:glycosyltransferase involved in cell wall biosynthesis
MSSNITAVISPSKFVMDLAIKNNFFHKSKKIVIPHGIDITSKVFPKQKCNNEFLYFGRLDEPKGIQIAIAAFRKNPSDEIKFHIAGSGPYENELKHMANDDKRIIFHGFLEKEKLNSLIHQCSYLIVPSIWYEPFGLVIIESLNRGMPVIASEIGAIPEIIINEYNGFLFEPRNANSLSNIIAKTIGNHQLLNKMSNNALSSSQNYPIDSVLKSVRVIYENLIK